MFYPLLAIPLIAASATDVAVYRTDRLDPRVQAVPAAIQQGVFLRPQQNIEPLVRSLLQGVSDDFHKVKILHDWVADNIAYDVESFLAGAQTDATWQNTLLRRKSVCHGYASLLEKMCQLAGIPCATISGHGRGYGFGSGGPENAAEVNHAWNGVQVAGYSYLVDVTWDAGYVEGRTFHKAYSTAYLFPQPGHFLHTHFPTDPRWQLLAPARTADQFLRLPYLPGRFFQQGLRMVSPLVRFQQVPSAIRLVLEVPADVLLSSEVKAATGPPLPRRTLIQRQGNRCHILATFPQGGRWTVQVFAKRRGDPGMFHLACSLELESTEGTTYTFPQTYTSYGSMDGCLHSPLYVPLAAGKPLVFKVGVSGAEQVSLVIGDKQWLPMKPVPEEKDVYQHTIEVPRGAAVRIMAKEPSRGASHWTLVDFTPVP